jgi:hypothetical protein
MQTGVKRKEQQGTKGKLPYLATQWVSYLLGFSVSVAVGLAPYLGRVKIPLFTPLLSLIPLTIQDVAIPVSSAAMGIVAVVVQWYGSTRSSGAWLSRMFVRALGSCILLFVVLLAIEMLAVERIDVPATGGRVSFVVGFSSPNKPPCIELSRADCIGKKIGLNPAAVLTYFGGPQVHEAELMLILTYTAFMSSFGGLVGLLVIGGRVSG